MRRWWPSALERHIALRYLRGQRGTRSASLQTVVAVGGIAVGVMALIVVLGVMNGLRDDLRDRILVASPHMRVLTFGDALVFNDWEDVADRIRAVPGVRAVAPEVVSYTLIENRGGHIEQGTVAGLEPGVGTSEVTGIDSVITEGQFVAGPVPGDSVEGSAILGADLAARLQVYPGDLIRVYSPQSIQTSRATGTPTMIAWVMRVTGIFKTGMYIYDSEFVVMDRATAQEFVGLGDAVSDLSVTIDDAWDAMAVKRLILDDLGPDYRVDTWQEQNSQLFSALRLEKLGMGLVIFFIMIVAAFNIVGTFTMLVNFKTREIGILQAMGLPSRAIGRIFLVQGMIIGLRGAFIGLLLGLATAFVVDTSGLIQLDPSVYFIDRLPIHVDPLDLVVVVIAAVLLAVLATIPPARRAAALAPVDAVRSE